MRINNKMVKDLLEVLEDLKKEMFQDEKKYPFAEWERNREKVKERIRKLPKYIEKASNLIEIEERTVGRPKQLDLKKRTTLFLFARLMNKSNRDVEELLLLFEPLFEFEVSYKYIERLYSDEVVKLALHNLFVLLLEDEGTSGSFSGDGTGYSLSIAKHYRSDPEKKGKKYRYVFRAIDIETGMYVAFGYSNRSEKDAFNKAMKMLKGVEINSIALDRYYSSRSVLKLFDKKTAVYVIPKKNLTNFGPEWTKIIERIVEDPVVFLKNYFKRNLSEAGFSADKRRFGWRIRQKREDRREAAMFSIALLHNIFTVRVRPG
jgi:Transposase